MDYAEFDYSKYPVVFIKMNPVAPTLEQHSHFFKQFERMFEMPEKAVIIFNAKNQKLISSEARIQAGHWVKRISPSLKDHVRCMVFTEASIWLSIVLKAIFIVASPPVPLHIVGSMEEARKLLQKEYKFEPSI